MTSTTREAGNPWELMLAACRGPVGLFAIFAVAHAALVLLGYSLKESVSAPAVMWPSSGLAFAALWLAPRRYWPVFLLMQFGVEVGLGSLQQVPFVPLSASLFALSNCIDAVVGASVVRLLTGEPAQVRTRHALQFMLAAATGAFAGALLGAWVNADPRFSPLNYLHQVQIWWAGDWLGSLTLAPVVYCWTSQLRRDIRELALASRLELLLLGVLVVASTLYVFAAASGGASSILQLPSFLMLLVVYAAFRLPPRWTMTLVAICVLLSAHLAAHQRGPFITADPFIRTAQVQAFLAAMAAMAFVLSIAVVERKIALGRLRDSDYRYRSFIEISAEALWRVELLQPMPVALPVERQVEWLREHARIVEASRTYQDLEPDARAGKLAWRPEVPWCASFEQSIAEAAKSGYSIDGLRFSLEVRGQRHSFIASFSGVVEDGRLLRLWGVARDVTELTALNARLLREQDRLKSYARQIGTAEEKARRATAVDLHDGIGQSLVGMAMTLEVASQHANSDVRLMLGEVRERLREVQERTRHMISDLSPPGLYDLGLGPALQWLAVYVRGHDQLQVELSVQVREEAIGVEMRVLIFKLVRELLRNVVKHAGVNAARLSLSGDETRLRVEVSDQGRGFEWQMDMFGPTSGGFGLWSIADRVREAGGTFEVDTAPGRGSRFEMTFSLQAPGQGVETGRHWARTGGAA